MMEGCLILSSGVLDFDCCDDACPQAILEETSNAFLNTLLFRATDIHILQSNFTSFTLYRSFEGRRSVRAQLVEAFGYICMEVSSYGQHVLF